MADMTVTTTAGGKTVLKEAAVATFKSRLRGELLRVDDSGYEDARKVWNGMIDRLPALIVRCAGVGDVVAAVSFAREHDLLVSVRCGGHNIAGKSVCERGLMTDLSPMRRIRVDRASQTVRVEGGATLGDLDRATQPFGLATTAGIVSHTGVGGLTLGGGVGRLARKHGLACDNLLSVEVVTADGRIVTASATENPDLFWGVRGGGGNFGIVIAFEFRLHPVGPRVLGGKVLYPLAKARAALKFYDEYARSASDELSADASLSMPDGNPVFGISVCYVGFMEQGQRELEPLRRFGPPLSDQIGPMLYTDVQTAADVFFPPGLRYYWKTHFLTEIRDEAIDALVTHFTTVPSPRSRVAFQQYGGAASRVGRTDTAFWHRDAQYDLIPTSVWTDNRESEANIKWVRELWDLMKPFASGGEYVNDLGEDGDDRVRAAYGANYEGLVALKNKYDPGNFFRLNANIKPTV